jgi:glycosyltransferase involved in cell wall biosynthesis
MRILHVSHESLPDWRIEKSAIAASKLDNEVFFAGRISNAYTRDAFSNIYQINWTAKARLGIPFYWHSVKKQLDKVLKATKPDVIHAHNIFSAKMASEFEIPFVYDDHEYWSRLSMLLREIVQKKRTFEDRSQDTKHLKNMLSEMTRIRRVLINSYAIRLWTNWEKEIVSSHPTITVSEQIAGELRTNYNAKNVFVVPNFPMYSEVKDFEKPRFLDSLSSVYAGVEARGDITPAHRKIDGFISTFLEEDIGNLVIIGWNDKSTSNKVKYSGFLSRQDMFREMFNHSIGLIPFKRHWSHIYISPNKAYEYAHAGLAVLTSSGFEPVKQILKEHCITFDDYEGMASKLMYFKENLDELYKRRLKIFDYARENLIWEKNEKFITEAYRSCT